MDSKSLARSVSRMLEDIKEILVTEKQCFS